ncbi:hypothetical protein CYMTET_33890, partial [Cymbomonas tetramitiformis]
VRHARLKAYLSLGKDSSALALLLEAIEAEALVLPTHLFLRLRYYTLFHRTLAQAGLPFKVEQALRFKLHPDSLLRHPLVDPFRLSALFDIRRWKEGIQPKHQHSVHHEHLGTAMELDSADEARLPPQKSEVGACVAEGPLQAASSPSARHSTQAAQASQKLRQGSQHSASSMTGLGNVGNRNTLSHLISHDISGDGGSITVAVPDSVNSISDLELEVGGQIIYIHVANLVSKNAKAKVDEHCPNSLVSSSEYGCDTCVKDEYKIQLPAAFQAGFKIVTAKLSKRNKQMQIVWEWRRTENA